MLQVTLTPYLWNKALHSPRALQAAYRPCPFLKYTVFSTGLLCGAGLTFATRLHYLADTCIQITGIEELKWLQRDRCLLWLYSSLPILPLFSFYSLEEFTLCFLVSLPPVAELTRFSSFF